MSNFQAPAPETRLDIQRIFGRRGTPGDGGGPGPGPGTGGNEPTLPYSFYGVNGHITWNWTPNGTAYTKPNWNTIIANMRDLGVSTIRNGFAIFTNGQNQLDSDAGTFIDFIDNYAAPAGIAVTPCLLADYDPGYDPTNNPVTNNTEASAYQVGFNIGSQVARLKGRVPWYEIGNEECSYCIKGGGVSGRYPGDYDNRRFTIVRGYWRGMIAGIRSIDTTTPLVSGGITWVHTAMLDMLRSGTQPDGTGGHPTVDWDITALHWYINGYVPNDDIESLTDQGGFNLLAKVASYGKPIHINECGVNFDRYGSSETDVAAALVGQYMMARWAAVAKQYNIKHVALYQLADAAQTWVGANEREMNFGLLGGVNGTVQKPRYLSVKQFILANRNPLA
jgi:hypothetical protein